MRKLWKSFLNWLTYIFTPEDLSNLRPGNCECDHNRSSHIKGKWECKASIPPDEEFNEWTECACQIYIEDKDNDNGDNDNTPSPEELEKLYTR
jgi:ferredoxin-thioredoxin reductase catalytic subunit